MRLLLPAAWTIAFVTLSVTASAGTAVLGPYLQRLTAKGVEIRVETLAGETASLELETDDHAKRAFTDTSAAFHTFHVTDLAPRTHYRYRVHVGAAIASGEFVTAPADDSREPFSFIVYGDNRTDDEAHAGVVRAIRGESLDFLVHTGDFVAAGGDPLLWQQFFTIEGTLLRDHCVFSCVGNHELVDDAAAANYVRYFGPTEGTDATLYGSFRWGSARFFLLNAFEDWGIKERSWLEAELARADAEPGVAWRFVVVHHSPWSSGHHGDDVKMLIAGIPALLVRHHVDLVLAGHDHIYERGENLGLKYIVSGGGGAPLYPDITPKPSTRKAEATHHFVLVSVSETGVRMTAKRPDGSTIESCGFGPRASWDCDGPVPSGAPVPTPEPPRSSSARCGCRVPGGHAGESEDAMAMLLLGAVALGRRGRRSPVRPLPSFSWHVFCCLAGGDGTSTLSPLDERREIRNEVQSEISRDGRAHHGSSGGRGLGLRRGRAGTGS
jgi:MYXO-CTERM domain-containing protein